MKNQYNFQNFDSEENTNTIPKKENTSIYHPSIDQESTKPYTETSTMKYQGEYIDRVKEMEKLIKIIKQNAYEKNKKELEDRLLLKNELETNIEILSSYIKMNRVQKRNFATLSKSIYQENERLSTSSQRAVEEQYYIQKELPFLRGEINQMQSNIGILNNETKDTRNQQLVIERDIMLLQDEIKKLNKTNSTLFSEKENIRNSINLLKKHCCIIREKISVQNDKSDELFNSLTYLAQKSIYENEAYNKRYGKK